MNKAKHTETPWETNKYGSIFPANAKRKFSGDSVSVTGFSLCSDEQGKANAEFIVRCVNSHNELVEALKLSISALNQIPNTNNNEYGTTYKLLLILEEKLKKAGA